MMDGYLLRVVGITLDVRTYPLLSYNASVLVEGLACMRIRIRSWCGWLKPRSQVGLVETSRVSSQGVWELHIAALQLSVASCPW
jgi:hypothetical protein